jgi:hypothetical protein
MPWLDAEFNAIAIITRMSIANLLDKNALEMSDMDLSSGLA